MRIGIDATVFKGNTYTGVSRCAYEIIRNWIKRYPEHEYFLFSGTTILPELILPNNWHRVVKPCVVGGAQVWNIIELPKLIKQNKIDAFWGPNFILPKKNGNIKYYVTVHDLAPFKIRGIAATSNSLKLKLFAKGESSACFGDASMFSFHATKVFNTIEGGCVCFKDDSWVQLLNDMKNFGIHGPESVQFVGANAKMNEFQATMGICNLKHLNKEIEKRKHVVEHYRSRLEGVEGIKLSIIQKDVESNYAYFPVVFDGYKYTRNEIFEKLAEVGIGARKYFYPLTNSFECYRNYPTAGAEKTPVAQHIALRVLTLPLYADLSLKDVDRICDVILG